MKYFSILLLLGSFNCAFSMEAIYDNYAIIAESALLIKDSLWNPQPGKAHKKWFNNNNITTKGTTLKDFCQDQFNKNKKNVLEELNVPEIDHATILSTGDCVKVNSSVNDKKKGNQYGLNEDTKNIVKSFFSGEEWLEKISIKYTDLKKGLCDCNCTYFKENETNSNPKLFAIWVSRNNLNTETLTDIIGLADIASNVMVQRANLIEWRGKNDSFADTRKYTVPFEEALTEERIAYVSLNNDAKKAQEFQNLFRKALIGDLDLQGFSLRYYALKNILLPSLGAGCGYIVFKAFKEHCIVKAVAAGLVGIGCLGSWAYGFFDTKNLKLIRQNLEHYDLARNLSLLKQMEEAK